MKIELNLEQYLEFDNLSSDVFKPLDGFVNETDYHSILEKVKTYRGDVFPIPIILDLKAEDAEKIRKNQTVDLYFLKKKVGEIICEVIYPWNKAEFCKNIFGTVDSGHPGVLYYNSLNPMLIGGKVKKVKTGFKRINNSILTPTEVKNYFIKKNWRTITGFQTRNVPHKAHEYLQKIALEYTDGLFIQPIIGKKKAGDYTPEAVIKGYKTLIKYYYPKRNVLLGALSTLMRYAGPREALFHAVIRRNFGCTHFIIGRDHAGVGNYYGKYEAHNFVKKYETEIDIKIFYFHGPYHCPKCGSIVTEKTCPHPKSIWEEINGKDMRAIFVSGSKPDERFMRPEVVNSIKGIKVFIDENEN